MCGEMKVLALILVVVLLGVWLFGGVKESYTVAPLFKQTETATAMTIKGAMARSTVKSRTYCQVSHTTIKLIKMFLSYFCSELEQKI